MIDEIKFKDKLKKYLFSISAQTFERADIDDIYRALVFTLREKIGENWELSKKSTQKNKMKYIMSFEYLPGKFLEKNLTYLGISDLCKSVLKDLNYDLNDLIDYESEPVIGHGALGEIAINEVVDLSCQKEAAVAYGIRYERGLMIQKLVDCKQVEVPDNWLARAINWEYRKNIEYKIDYKDFSVRAVAYDYPILGYKNSYVNTLRLWGAEPIQDIKFESFSKCDFIDAYDEYIRAKSISEFLYPDDTTNDGKRFRLIQEIFYASASVQDIIRRYLSFNKNKKIDEISDYVNIGINDTHPTFTIPEFMLILKNDYKVDFEESFEIALKLFDFTQYDILSESYEVWNMRLIEEVKPDYVPIIEYINKRFENITNICLNNYNIIKDGYFYSANLLVLLAKRINVFSNDHINILKKESYDLYQINKDKIKVTKVNVNYQNWLIKTNPELYRLINNKLNFENNHNINRFIDLKTFSNDKNFLEDISKVKTDNKVKLSNELYKNYELRINPNAIFDMKLDRFHEYKRQLLLALYIAEQYFDLKDNPNKYQIPKVYFFSGKASSSYYTAKEILAFILNLSELINNDFMIKDKLKLVFLENYSITVAEKLFRAMDVNESISTPSKELVNLSVLKGWLNSAVSIVSDSGLNKELESLAEKETIYKFGIDSLEALSVYENNSYSPMKLHVENKKLTNLLDRIAKINSKYYTFDFNVIYNLLLKYNDSFLVLKDYDSFSKEHEKIYENYCKGDLWSKIQLKCLVSAGKYMGGKFEL